MIDDICKEYNIKNYTINQDGSIDVDGDVNIVDGRICVLPLIFNIVNGNFDCSNNYLTTLERSPKYVSGDFKCNANQLITLKGAPQYIGGDFVCSSNKIITLDYFPDNVGDIYCARNPIEYIYNTYIQKIDNIELFNSFNIIKENTINVKRLNNYCVLNNYDKVHRSYLRACGYTII